MALRGPCRHRSPSSVPSGRAEAWFAPNAGTPFMHKGFLRNRPSTTRGHVNDIDTVLSHAPPLREQCNEFPPCRPSAFATLYDLAGALARAAFPGCWRLTDCRAGPAARGPTGRDRDVSVASGDAFLPPMDLDRWGEVEREEKKTQDGTRFAFADYERIAALEAGDLTSSPASGRMRRCLKRGGPLSTRHANGPCPA